MPRKSFFDIKEMLSDRRKMLIFLTCIVVSLGSWMLISLSKNFNTTLFIPVKYINFPPNKTLLNQVPNQLAINVSGSGYELLQFDDSRIKDTLIINLDNLQMGVYRNFQRGYLDQSVVSKELQNRLNGALRLNQVLSDSINFLFDLKVVRSLPVKSRLVFTVTQGYVQSDPLEFLPQEVEVQGALSILDTMQHINTEKIDLGELSKSMVVRVALQKVSFFESESRMKDSVDVSIPIDRLTEKTFLLQPLVRNIPDSLTMLVFPNSIEVTVQVPLNYFDEVTDEALTLYVDYNELKNGVLVLPVHLEEWTTKAHKVSFEPQKVEVVLTQKE
jgi:hypothetical protein